VELRRLDVHRLPGIDQGFSLGFAPGVNLIQGPNGSGKSSVTRAILGLLFAEGSADARSEVTGVFAAGGREFFAERAGAPHASWRAADGGPVPARPAIRTAAAFHLGLLDLHKTAAGSDDQVLAGEIRSRMAGGYDIARLLDEETFRLPAKRLAVATEVQESRQAVDLIRREFAEVADDERDLPELDRRIRRGDDATKRGRVLELADRQTQARRRAAAAASNLAALPAVLKRLRGDEADRCARLAKIIETEGASSATATAAADRAQRDLTVVALAPAPTAALLTEARARVDAARADEGLLHRHDEDVAAAQLAAAERGRQLDPAWPPDRREPTTPADLAEAETLVRRDSTLGAQEQAVAGQLARADIDAAPDVPDAGPRREALSHLAAWLGVPDADLPQGRRWPAVLACGVLIATGLGWFAAGGGVLAAVAAGTGVVLLAVVLAASSGPNDLAGRRRHAEDALRATSVAPPPAWKRDAVTQRLRDVACELAAVHEAAKRHEWRQQLLAEQTRLQGERERLTAQSRELAGRCGLDPVATAVEVSELLRRVAEHHAALARCEEVRGKQLAASARLQGQLDELGTLLAPYGGERSSDVVAAASRVADLERRFEMFREATSRLGLHRDAIAGAQTRLAAAQDEWSDLFQSLALPIGAVNDLERLLALHPSYLQAANEHDVAELAVRYAEAEAASSPAAADIAAAALFTDDQRAAELADLRDAPGDAAKALEDKGRVKGLAKKAQDGTKLQDALARLDGARARWQRERERAHENALARALLNAVAAEHQARSLPPVLARATALFAQFTAGRYHLRVERVKASDSFVAHDAATGRPLGLHELSDGTRAQLLLAARLAFVEDAEGGEPLPLLLDDALSATDPTRFAAVSGALLDLVSAQGRQILVFTASPAAVAAWQQTLAAAGQANAPVIDLAAVRTGAAMAPLPALAAPTLAVVPAPGDADAADYARTLSVPPLDLQAPAGAAHLFYLLGDDLALLHRFLTEGTATWGAAAALAAALGRPGGDLAPDAWHHLAQRAAALEAFLAAQRIGRGRAVDRAVLRDCVKLAESTKAAEIEALLPGVEGRADRLLDALRAKQIQRVGAKLIEELADHLRAGGYLDDRPTLSPDDLGAQVVAAVRPAVAAGDLNVPELNALVEAWTTATASRPQV
jgi:exonuclease SbcC